MKKNVFDRIKRQINAQTRSKVDSFEIKNSSTISKEIIEAKKESKHIDIIYDQVYYTKKRNDTIFLTPEIFAGTYYDIYRGKINSQNGNLYRPLSQYENLCLSVNLFSHTKKEITFNVLAPNCNVSIFVDENLHTRLNDDWDQQLHYVPQTVRVSLYKNKAIRVYVYAKRANASIQISGDIGSQIDSYSSVIVKPLIMIPKWDDTNPISFNVYKDGDKLKPYVSLKFGLDDSANSDGSVGGFGIYYIDFSKNIGTIIEKGTGYIRVDNVWTVDKYVKINNTVKEVDYIKHEFYSTTNTVTTLIYLIDDSGIVGNETVYAGKIVHKADMDVAGDIDGLTFEYKDYDVEFGQTYYYLINIYDNTAERNKSGLTSYQEITINDNTIPPQITDQDVEISADGNIIHCKIAEDYAEPIDIKEYRWWFALTNSFPTGAVPDRIGRDVYYTAHAGIPYYIFVAAVDIFGNYSTNYTTTVTPSGYQTSGLSDVHISNGGVGTPSLADNAVTAAKADIDDIFAQDITVEGQIHGGKINYTDTNAGWWIGKDGTTYKINVGNNVEYIKWDGSSLSISGSVNITNPGDINASEISNDIGWDGRVEGFFQDTAPTSGMKYGDIWIDTDGSWSGVTASTNEQFYLCNPQSRNPIGYYRSPIVQYYNNKTYFIWVSGLDTEYSYVSNYIDIFDHSTNQFLGGAPLTVYNQNPNFSDFTLDLEKYGIGGNVYTSDFSQDYDGWVSVRGTKQGNIDGIGGLDDNLQYTVGSYTGDYEHYLLKSISSPNGSNTRKVKVKYKIYIPSGNVDVNGVRINMQNGTLLSGTQDITTLDAWIENEVIFEISNYSLDRIYLYALKDGSQSYPNSNGTDTFYVREVVVDELGAIGYWQFDDVYHQDETSQDILYDITGNGHNLTASAGFDYVNQMTGSDPTYQGGNTVEFDGVNDNFYIPAADATVFNPGTEDFSFSLWVKVDSDPASDYAIFSKGGYYNQNGFMFRKRSITDKYEIYVPSGDGSTYWVSNSSLTAINGQWNHFIFSFDRDGEQAVWVNGSKVWSQTVTNTADNNNNYDLIIGNNNVSCFIANVTFFNFALSDQQAKELYGLAKKWSWDGIGSISNDNFQQVVSSGGTVSQQITGLDSNTEYRLTINGTDTFVTGVTDYTIQLTDGTYNYVQFSDLYPLDIGPHKWGTDIHHVSSMELCNDGHFLVAYDPLSPDGQYHNYAPYFKRSTQPYSVKEFTDIGTINYQNASTILEGSYPMLACGTGNTIFVFVMGEGNGQPQYTIRMAKSTDNGQTWGYAYDVLKVNDNSDYWAYPKILDYEIGGWIRLAIFEQWHLEYKIQNVYIVKTKDGQTWYNEDETWSKDVITNGYITPTELDNNCLVQQTEGATNFTYLIYSSAVDKNDKLYFTLYRYSYPTDERKLYFMYSNGSGSWYKKEITELNQPTYGALIANDDGSFTLININNDSNTLDVFYSNDNGDTWVLLDRLMDLRNEDDTLGYLFNTVRKREQDKYNILFQRANRDSNGTFLGYSDFYLLSFNKNKIPTENDIYRYEDVNGANIGTLDWYNEPENSIGKTFLENYQNKLSINRRGTIYYQETEPTYPDLKRNDIWVDTDNSYKTYVYNGKQWVPATVQTYYSNTAPTDNLTVGDIWIDTDDNNKKYRWDGANWVSVRDTYIADENGLIQLPVTPSGSGLYIGSTHLGYYEGGLDWKTYMDNQGNFYLNGSDGYLTWNSSTDTLTIKGEIHATSGSFDGSLNVSTTGSIYGGKTSFSDITGGFWLGYDIDNYKLKIGNTNRYIEWDGTNLTVIGEISTSNSGSKIVLNPDYDRIDFHYNVSGTDYYTSLLVNNGDLRIVASDGDFGTLYVNYLNSNFVDQANYSYYSLDKNYGLKVGKVLDTYGNDSLAILKIDQNNNPYFELSSADSMDGFVFSISKTVFGNVVISSPDTNIEFNTYEILPSTNNYTYLGNSSFRFKNIYSVNGNISGTLTVQNLTVNGIANISGLDADTLDGIDSTQFMRNDTNNTISGNITPSTDATYSIGSSTNAFMAGYFNSLYVNNNAVWHEGNDGSGSGLNADLLDGKDSTAFLKSIEDNVRTTNLFIEPRNDDAGYTQIGYSNNLFCFADRVYNATVLFHDGTGVPVSGVTYPERIFDADGSDSYTVLDMSAVPNTLYVTVSMDIPTTTSPMTSRIMATWHGSSGYSDVSFKVKTAGGTEYTIPLWKSLDGGKTVISQQLGEVFSYNANDWPLQEATVIFSNKTITSGNRYLYSVMWHNHRTDYLPYLVNKSGDTIYGTLNSETINPRASNTHSLGSSSYYWKYLYSSYVKMDYLYALNNSVIYGYNKMQLRSDGTADYIFSLQSTSSTNSSVYMDFRQYQGGRLGWIGADTSGNITISSDDNGYGTNKIRIGTNTTTETEISGYIVNDDIVKPTFSISGDGAPTKTVTINIADLIGNVSDRIGTNIRGTAHIWLSTSVHGALYTNPNNYISTSLTAGQMITPSSFDPTSVNYVSTDANGNITFDVTMTGAISETLYAHCEFQGITYVSDAINVVG